MRNINEDFRFTREWKSSRKCNFLYLTEPVPDYNADKMKWNQLVSCISSSTEEDNMSQANKGPTKVDGAIKDLFTSRRRLISTSNFSFSAVISSWIKSLMLSRSWLKIWDFLHVKFLLFIYAPFHFNMSAHTRWNSTIPKGLHASKPLLCQKWL